jgi:hypothetical protein
MVQSIDIASVRNSIAAVPRCSCCVEAWSGRWVESVGFVLICVSEGCTSFLLRTEAGGLEFQKDSCVSCPVQGTRAARPPSTMHPLTHTSPRNCSHLAHALIWLGAMNRITIRESMSISQSVILRSGHRVSTKRIPLAILTDSPLHSF